MKLLRNKALVLLALGCLASPLPAAVKTRERSKVDFPGLLGGMVRFFGGKAAKEGVESSTAVQGDRLMRITDKRGELIDLAAEEIHEIEFDKKRYRTRTFEEYRQQLREAQDKMAQQQAKAGQDQPQDKPAQEMEIDFDVKSTGRTREINSVQCAETVMTITVREKGKTLEEAGGMVLTSDMWMGPSRPEMKEVADFYMRYAEKIGLVSLAGASEAQLGMIQKMYPHMKDAMEKFQSENVNMDGTAMLTEMKIESVLSAAQRQQQDQQQQAGAAAEEKEAPPTSIGGVLGGLGRKWGRKKAEESQKKEQQEAAPGRAQLMTMTSEMLLISQDVSEADTTIPATFKQQR
jgi:hypothetical protein